MKPVIVFISLMMMCCFCYTSQSKQLCQDSAALVASPADQKHMMQVGEELEYSVHYSFFNIGVINFKITGMEVRNGRKVYFIHAVIESNPSLNWLKELHVKFYSEIDEDMFSYYWLGEDSSSRGINYTRMKFDYANNNMYYESGKKISSDEYKPEKKKTVSISSKCQDGVSLFFYARNFVHQDKTEHVPTYMDTLGLTTDLNFKNTLGKKEIDAVNYPLSVVYFDGHADFTGIFGLTGGFEGWFSNDDACIPIVAKMKVFLGSVRVELTKWKRNEWTPPQVH